MSSAQFSASVRCVQQLHCYDLDTADFCFCMHLRSHSKMLLKNSSIWLAQFTVRLWLGSKLSKSKACV